MKGETVRYRYLNYFRRKYAETTVVAALLLLQVIVLSTLNSFHKPELTNAASLFMLNSLTAINNGKTTLDFGKEKIVPLWIIYSPLTQQKILSRQG
jgi:hypothetical protein